MSQDFHPIIRTVSSQSMGTPGLQISVYETFLTKFPYFFTKPYRVTTHKNRLEKTILISGHLVGFG